MHLLRKFEARSYNHCYCGKRISITYSEYVFVALGTQCAKRVRRIVFCGLSCFTKIWDIFL